MLALCLQKLLFPNLDHDAAKTGLPAGTAITALPVPSPFIINLLLYENDANLFLQNDSPAGFSIPVHNPGEYRERPAIADSLAPYCFEITDGESEKGKRNTKTETDIFCSENNCFRIMTQITNYLGLMQYLKTKQFQNMKMT
jgi:hypothetical protein